MPYSEIPTWLVKRAPIDWELELRAGLSLPLSWGAWRIPPLSVGTLSLFEMAVVQFLRQPIEAPWQDLMRGVYIAIKREDAHELCQRDRAWTQDFEFEKPETWSPLDVAAIELLADAKLSDEAKLSLFSAESRLELWRFFDVAFEGYRMIHGGADAQVGEWLFGLDSVASYAQLMGSMTNEPLDRILWRLPVAMGSMLSARHLACNDPKVKLYREPDHGHIDRLRDYIRETEDAGELLYWQRMHPDRYDLSERQVERGGESLVKEFGRVALDVAKLSREERAARAEKISQEEGVL